MPLDPNFGVAPWVTTINCPDLEDVVVEVDLADQAMAAATEVLWALSGRRFGYRTLRARPCTVPCSDPRFVEPLSTAGSLGSGPWVGAALYTGCGSCATRCRCKRPRGVRLTPVPVAEILSVQIGADVLDPSAYRLDDHRLLVRVDGDEWPTTNDFDAALGEDGVFEIEYRTGSPIPHLGLMAVEELACEFIRARLNLDCNLPARITSVSRQGVSFTLLDPQQFLDEGRVGIYTVDLFLRTMNPNKLKARPRIYRADAPYRGTVRPGDDGS